MALAEAEAAAAEPGAQLAVAPALPPEPAYDMAGIDAIALALARSRSVHFATIGGRCVLPVRKLKALREEQGAAWARLLAWAGVPLPAPSLPVAWVTAADDQRVLRAAAGARALGRPAQPGHELGQVLYRAAWRSTREVMAGDWFRDAFPEGPEFSDEELYRLVNKAEPSFIRVEFSERADAIATSTVVTMGVTCCSM